MAEGLSGFAEQLVSNPFFKNGGVFVTIAINIILLAVFGLLYLCCLRCCTVFNMKKKKVLIAKSLKREDELFGKTTPQKQMEQQPVDEQSIEKIEHETDQIHTENPNEQQSNQPTTDEKGTIEDDQIHTANTSVEGENRSQNVVSKKKKAIEGFDIDSSFYEVKDLRKHFPGNSTKSYWYLRTMFLWRITGSLIQSPFFMAFRSFTSGTKPYFSSSKKEEKRILRNYGRDILTYVKFHQLVWWVILIMCILFSILLYPIHITNQNNLDPAQREKYSKNVTGLQVGSDDQFLVISSINTVIGRPDILITHVILSAITVLLVLGLLLLFLRDKSLKQYDFGGCDEEGIYGSYSPYLPCYFGAEFYLKTQNMALGTSHDDLMYKTLSPFTLEIHNIPKHFTNKQLFDQLMRKMFSHNANDLMAPVNTQIISCYHVINYEKREKLQAKFEQELQNLENYNLYLKKKNKRPKKTCFFSKSSDESKRKLLEKHDAISYTKDKLKHLNQDIITLEEDLTFSRNYPNRVKSSITGSGIGYVVFSSSTALKQALKHTRFGAMNVYKLVETDEHGEQIMKLLTPAEKKQLPNEIKVKKVRMRATTTYYEPRDCNWTNLYTMYQHSWIKPVLLRIIIFLAILIIFIFFTTPVVVVSSIDTFFAIPAVTSTIKKIVEVGGPMMSVLFQYIPSLLLVVSSAVIPIIIYQLTKLEDMKTFSEFSRTLLRRFTIFLWLNTFILPTLVLTTLDGVTNFFTNPDSWINIFKNLFVSDNGSLFMNFILNKTLWGLTFTFIPLFPLIMYVLFTRCTSKFSHKIKANRTMKPKDKLKYAEGPAMYTEVSYATTFTILAITFTFSLFSPFILLIALIYFTLRYYVERYTIARTYSHRMIQHEYKKRRQLITSQSQSEGGFSSVQPTIFRHHFGCLFGFKTDYLSHRRFMLLLARLTLVSLIMFTVYCMLFFASKVPESNYFIFHVTIEALLTAILLFTYFALNLKMTRDIKRVNARQHLTLEERANVKTMYEPSAYWSFKNMFNDTVTNL